MSSLNSITAKARQSELLPIILLLCLGIAIIWWQVLLLGYMQVPADIPNYLDPVMRQAMPDPPAPQNGLLSDHSYQFHVWHTLAGNSMQEDGRIPLWNPYILAGQPLLANAQPALFYPPNLLLMWIDAGHVAAIRSMFNILVAGVFTFCFARVLRISKLGATLSAIAFAFSGTLIVGPGHAYANTLVWLPMMLWASEKLLTDRQSVLWVLVTSIGVGLSFLGGHPESTFHNLLVLTLYLMARLIFMDAAWQWKAKSFILFSSGLLLGLSLGAVQWLPFIGWWVDSATQSRSPVLAAESAVYSSEWLQNLPLLVTLLFPGFFGNPVDGTYFWPFANFQNYLEQSMYFGLIPAALAVGAIFNPERRKIAAAGILAVLALVMLAVALRMPGFELFNHLPVMDRVNNERLKWYFTLFGAVLAGGGLDALTAFLRAGGKRNRRFFYPVAAVFALALLIVLVIVVGKLVLGSLVVLREDSFFHHLVFNTFSTDRVRAVVSVLVTVLGAGLLAFSYRPRRQEVATMIPILLVGLTFVELVVHAYDYNTLLPKEKIFPPVRLTETLAEDSDTFRILSVEPAFWPNYGAVYGLTHVGGYDLPVHKRYTELYSAQGGAGYRQRWLPEWPLVDWMNVKYVISPQELTLEKLELVYQDGYWLYKNNDVLPRAYMVYDAVVIEDDEKLLQTLTVGDFDFKRLVALEEGLPPQWASAMTPPASDAESGLQAVQIVQVDNDVVEMVVETETAGLLVMSDVLSPGWQATVDEQPVELQRANYAFRAVFVPAGTHQVVFSYEPLEFQIGATLSALALLLLVAGFAATVVARRR